MPGAAEPLRLPSPPSSYQVADYEGVWMVAERASGHFVYVGPGPVRLDPAP